MVRTRPLMDASDEKQRLLAAQVRRVNRWQVDKPNGTSVRQLRRAVANGYAPNVVVRHPEKYLNSSRSIQAE